MEETVILPNEVEYRDIPNHDVLITILLSFGGFALGYDSVALTGFIPILKNKYSISFQMQSLIVGIIAVGAFVACIAAPILNDRFGRRKAILVSCGISVIGDTILAFDFGKIFPWKDITILERNIIIIARFITGLSIGLTSSTVPMYIVECAIQERRGCLTTSFQFAITMGYFVSSILSFGLLNQDYGFRLLVALNIIPVFFLALSTICLPESPRWLALNRRDDEARDILCRIHGSDKGIDNMIKMIHENADSSSRFSVLLRVLRCRSTRRALLVGGLVQLMQPLSGIEALILFAPTLFRLGGTRVDNTVRTWMIILGVLAFSSLIPFFYVERVGRKKLMLISLLGISCSQAVSAGGLLLSNIGSLKTEHVYEPPPGQPKSHCAEYGNCFFCAYDKACGFCFEPAPVTLHYNPAIHGSNGSCLPIRSQDARASAYGPCRFYPQKENHQFLTRNCPFNREAMNMGVAGSAFFLLLYAMGTGAVPWIVSAETLPTWARSTGVAASVSMRWAMSAIIIISFFDIVYVLPRYGSWLCFAVCCLLGALVFAFLLSESKDAEMEQFTL